MTGKGSLSLLKTGSHRDQQEAMEGALKYVTDKYAGGKGSGSGGGNPIDAAREAIARGADRTEVIKRLKKAGVSNIPGDL